MAAPSRRAMIVTTSMISRSVKPCCFLSIVIQTGRGTPSSFAVTLAGDCEFSSGRFSEDNPTCPKDILVESAWRELPTVRYQPRSRPSDHWCQLLDSRRVQFSARGATPYIGNAFV